MAEAPARPPQKDTVTRTLQQCLPHHQRQQLVVADLLRPPAAGRPVGRKQRAGSAVKCDQEGVEVGAHVGLQVDGLQTPPTFDTPIAGPYPVITAPTVNYRSII